MNGKSPRPPGRLQLPDLTASSLVPEFHSGTHGPEALLRAPLIDGANFVQRHHCSRRIISALPCASIPRIQYRSMTLPEHAMCSLMLAQLGCRQRHGWRGVSLIVLAGISPDVDVVTKLISEPLFWKLHHALGHSIASVAVLSALLSGLGRVVFRLPFVAMWGWCLAASVVHLLTDIPYWWGVRIFWPFSEWELRLDAIEYLDLLVLGLWLNATALLYFRPCWGFSIGTTTLTVFASYVAIRWMLPKPTGTLYYLTGGWMYAAPSQTPILDWW
jgi:membrane-bound metal-dependent hydrolase YbcI (DUF457 family)